VKPQRQGKAKRLNFKIFQTVVVKRRPNWNESKQPLAAPSVGLITDATTDLAVSATVCR
jgi:hypothetical protein